MKKIINKLSNFDTSLADQKFDISAKLTKENSDIFLDYYMEPLITNS